MAACQHYRTPCDTSTWGAAAIFNDSNEDGFVVIEANSGDELEVWGTAWKSDGNPSWSTPSDRRIKTGIHSLQDALGVIDRLRPVRFHYSDAHRARHPGVAATEQFGIVAQEFANVFPDFVSTNADGYLTVNTSPLTFFNTAAIRELHAQLKEKDAEIEALKQKAARVDDLQKRLGALEKRLDGQITAQNRGAK